MLGDKPDNTEPCPAAKGLKMGSVGAVAEAAMAVAAVAEAEITRLGEEIARLREENATKRLWLEPQGHLG